MGKTETSAIFVKGDFVIYINSLLTFIGLTKKFVWFKNPNELFGQPNIFFKNMNYMTVLRLYYTSFNWLPFVRHLDCFLLNSAETML